MKLLSFSYTRFNPYENELAYEDDQNGKRKC